MIPNFSRAHTIVAECRAYNTIAQVALAVELSRRATGKLPQSLEEMLNGELTAMPIDPFDGRPMRYKAVDDEMCVIWSLGQDSTDNGGQPPDIAITLDYQHEE